MTPPRRSPVPGQVLVSLRFNPRVAEILVPRGRRRRRVRARRSGWQEFDRILERIGVRSLSRIHQPFPAWTLRHQHWGRHRRSMDSTFLLTFDPQRLTTARVLDYLNDWKVVLSAEPNVFVRSLQMPPGPLPAAPWFEAIGLPDAWATTRGDPSIVVAVIDSGVARAHPEFPAGRLRIESGCDVVDCIGVRPPFGNWTGDSMRSDDDPDDDFGHGTFMAGLIAGETRGVAPGCRLLPVRALATAVSSTSVRSDVFAKADDLARATRFAVDHGARILNLSYGNAAADDPGSNAAERHAVEDALAHGCFLAAAMGNDGAAGNIMYPAAYRAVCGVAALTADGAARWPGSQTGSHCDLSAPGAAIQSASRNGGFEVRTGTSNATAIVSGVAALVLSACAVRGKPLPVGKQLGAILTGTARPFTASLPSFDTGYGRVDAHAAVAAALAGQQF